MYEDYLSTIEYPSVKQVEVRVFTSFFLKVTFGVCHEILPDGERSVEVWDSVQVVVQLLPVLFFSNASSICLCLRSRISILLASFRARSCALSSSTSSKNLCLQRRRRNKIINDIREKKNI